ncbi:hypothetical protein EDD21DRAFT_418552 [Dissophora ornata]|nr:hypothetical protein BGZ58_001743 [Dissophora ornata]KAI8597609.1 hypothetical protein EDD21DRAFT_418552 [Dissophora ornata]
MSSRHRALLGALLIFSIGSLLTLSFQFLADDTYFVSTRAASSTLSTPDEYTPDSTDFPSNSSPVTEDRLGTGAIGADPDNNSLLDPLATDYSTISLDSLKQLIRDSLLFTTDNLKNPNRPIQLKSSVSVSKLQPVLQQFDTQHPGNDKNGEDWEEKHMEEIGSTELEDNTGTEFEDNSNTNSGEDGPGESNPPPEQSQLEGDEPFEGGQKENDQQQLPWLHYNDTLLSDFDVNKVLSPSDNFLLFIPSGETIEAQFFSLLTSLWIAKHSNRTLIIPPPMMSPPSLNHLYPVFAGPKGKKRQRWSTLFDLRFISNEQPIVLIDKTRPVLQTPFTTEMALEEEHPSVSQQPIPDTPTSDTLAAAILTAPTSIKCHGPPTAGSWKTLDFAGRHFLNRYNLVADFEVLEEPYWNLTPEAIQKNWGLSSEEDRGTAEGGRHGQIVCIAGAEFIGAEDPVIEEMIWQEIGLQIPFSNAIKVQALQTVEQVLRGVEHKAKAHGYIGVHIDKLPSREFCGSQQVVSSQCHWSAELISKRIALLQRTERKGPRPVILTTTETDSILLAHMDHEGWFRIAGEDDGGGLFEDTTEMDNLGGYGSEVLRAFVMANSAIFVGSRSSSLAMHAAFRIKYEGRIKEVAPRWELY